MYWYSASYMVPLIIGISILAGNVSSAASFPDHLRSMDKMCLDSHLMSVLLMDVEAALKAKGLCSWLVLSKAATLPKDVVFNVKELPICVVDGESDLKMSTNVF